MRNGPCDVAEEILGEGVMWTDSGTGEGGWATWDSQARRLRHLPAYGELEPIKITSRIRIKIREAIGDARPRKGGGARAGGKGPGVVARQGEVRASET
jgi:hypothetical protein